MSEADKCPERGGDLEYQVTASSPPNKNVLLCNRCGLWVEEKKTKNQKIQKTVIRLG